jgi:hypothetical protein
MTSGNLSSIQYDLQEELAITNDIIESEKIEIRQFLEVS